jgi:hypothetical protein
MSELDFDFDFDKKLKSQNHTAKVTKNQLTKLSENFSKLLTTIIIVEKYARKHHAHREIMKYDYDY